MNYTKYIADNYGSKRGLARYIKFNLKHLLGTYRSADRDQVGKVERLIYICSGNICRSPFGEAVSMKAGFPAISFGLHCRGDDEAFEKTLHYAKRHGYNLERHRSARMQDYQPMPDDLLIVMEPAHLDQLNKLYPEQNKVLIGRFANKPTVYLHDPYNTNQVFFDKCMQQIEEATLSLINTIKK